MNTNECILNACRGSDIISMLMEKACFISFYLSSKKERKKEFYISWRVHGMES